MVHDFLEIFYIVKGSIKITTEFESKQLNAGDIYIISPNLVHRITPSDEDNILLFLQCDCKGLEKMGNIDNNNIIINKLDNKVKDELINILGNIYLTFIDTEILESDRNSKVIVYINKMVNIISRLEKKQLMCTFEKNNDIKYLVADIIKRLPDNIKNEEDTGLDKIANSYNISYSYLSRTFKKIIGENYTDYLLKIKMNLAVDLLINTQLKISQVAVKSGFTSIKTFNNTFRKVFDISPSKFRQKYMNIENIERISPLFLDINTQMFIEYIYTTNAKNRKKESDNKHIIDVKTNNICIKEGLTNVLHLDCILTTEFNVIDISEKLEELDPEYLIIELYYDGEELYVIKSDNNKEKVSDKEFNILVNVMNKNDITPFVRINYSEVDLSKAISSYESYYDVLRDKINLLYVMIGYDKVNKYIFEMYIPNMKDYLIGKEDLNNLVKHIEEFRKILRENAYSNAENFGIYFGEISKYKDFEAMDRLFELVRKPDFINFDIGLEMIMGSSVKYMINLLDDIKKYINIKYGEIPIVAGFNYKVNDDDVLSEENIIYYNLFLAKIHIYLQKSGYILIGSNITYNNYKKIIGKFTDIFGIKQSPYYAYKMLSQVKGEVVMIQPGIIAARDQNKRELSIYLYEDYDVYIDNIYKYGYENYILSSKNVNFTIAGLNGLYKMSKYILSSKGDWIKETFIDDKRAYLSIEKDEIDLIQNRYKPDLEACFFESNGCKDLSILKKPNDVVLLKIKRI